MTCLVVRNPIVLLPSFYCLIPSVAIYNSEELLFFGLSNEVGEVSEALRVSLNIIFVETH